MNDASSLARVPAAACTRRLDPGPKLDQRYRGLWTRWFGYRSSVDSDIARTSPSAELEPWWAQHIRIPCRDFGKHVRNVPNLWCEKIRPIVGRTRLGGKRIASRSVNLIEAGAAGARPVDGIRYNIEVITFTAVIGAARRLHLTFLYTSAGTSVGRADQVAFRLEDYGWLNAYLVAFDRRFTEIIFPDHRVPHLPMTSSFRLIPGSSSHFPDEEVP